MYPFNEWAAVKAAQAIRVNWTGGTGLPDQATVCETWRRRLVAKEEVTQNVGDAKAALDGSAKPPLRARFEHSRELPQMSQEQTWLQHGCMPPRSPVCRS
jgi:hypothetical protein